MTIYILVLNRIIMDRKGPGFLTDLGFFWITIIVCMVAADTIVRQFGRPIGLLLAVGAAVVLAFTGLLAYYRIFLDRRPILGTHSRSRFAILWIQIVFFGFVLGAVVGPPDPYTQLGIAGVVTVVGFLVSYWFVYRNDSNAEQAVASQ